MIDDRCTSLSTTTEAQLVESDTSADELAVELDLTSKRLKGGGLEVRPYTSPQWENVVAILRLPSENSALAQYSRSGGAPRATK